MKKIIIACDSFKGSMSASQVCKITAKAIKDQYPDAQVQQIPVADGGEGTVEAYKNALGGKTVTVKVKSPLLNDIDAVYAVLEDNTAVIECAAASGITLERRKDALAASSYGTGQLIRDALDRSIRSFVIGLGGSATTDGGKGMLSALGARFLDGQGRTVAPGGQGLADIRTVELKDLDKRISRCDMTVLCDVTNPLYGEKGAAYVFSPQKGADERAVRLLDKGLRNFASVCRTDDGEDLSVVPGTGAAGGLGFALLRFCGAKLKSGIETILDMTDFECLSREADIVITGEGKLDSQSFSGKVPFGVAARSKAKKCIAVVGVLDEDADRQQIQRLGIREVYETNVGHLPFETVLASCETDLYNTVKNINL